MAARTPSSTRLYTLALGAALALAPPALAGDVSVKLDTGSGLSVKNGTGAIERLRVDEATGNLSRNGALFVHTTGGLFSTFVGASSGNVSSTGQRNSGFGNSALRDNTTGSYNAAFGQGALAYNTTGSNNSAVGEFALVSNTTGSRNSGFGTGALMSNAAGDDDTAAGYRSLLLNSTGIANSAFGSLALSSNTTASYNTAIGFQALAANTTGTRNTAVGGLALSYNTTGKYNAAFGSSALRSNTTGTENSAFGLGALSANSTGTANTAFGSGALGANSTGIRNTAIGRFALATIPAGNNNIAIGFESLFFDATGSDNLAIGNFSLFHTSAGNTNLAVGVGAGQNQTTGSNNIYLANVGVAAESGQIKIGTAGTQTAATIAGIRGVTTGVADAIPVVIDSTGQLGTLSSSRTVKREIRDMGDATDRLLDLRPVTFRYKQAQTLPSGGEVPPEYGLIAEEVAEVFPDLVVYDEKGQPFTVKYHEMAPMLLNEMKKQQRTIEAQRQEIAALTTRLARVETRMGGATGEE